MRIDLLPRSTRKRVLSTIYLTVKMALEDLDYDMGGFSEENWDKLSKSQRRDYSALSVVFNECKLLQRELDGESKESIEKDYEDVNELIKCIEEEYF